MKIIYPDTNRLPFLSQSIKVFIEWFFGILIVFSVQVQSINTTFEKEIVNLRITVAKSSR